VGDGVLLLERLHEAGLTLFVLGAAVEVDGQELPQGTVLLFQSMHQELLKLKVGERRDPVVFLRQNRGGFTGSRDGVRAWAIQCRL
jgi:hypothetical protein